jgi:MFS family permease
MYLSLADQRARRAAAAAAPGTKFRPSPVIISLGVVSLLTDISSESVAAILPLYLTGVLGLSVVAYGFVDALQQGMTAVVRLYAGWVADRTRQPKWVATAGYGLSMLARGGLLLAQGLAGITAVLALDRLGKGIRTAPRDAMIAAVAQPEHLARSFGLHRMLDTIGATLGPLIAFLVLLLVPQGYSTVFVVSLAFAAVGVAVLGLFVPNRLPPAPTVQQEPIAATQQDTGGSAVLPAGRKLGWRDLNVPALRRLLLVAGLLGLLTVGDGFLYLVLQGKTSFAAAWFPLLFIGTNTAYLLLAMPVGRLADRWGRMRVFLLGHGALLLAYVLAAVPMGGWQPTVVCLVMLGAFYAATDGVLAALAGKAVPETGRATAIAAAQTVAAGSRALASIGFGLLWFGLGRGAAMWLVAVCLALVLSAVVLILRPGSRRTE